jgi:hypothetical protein
MSDPWLKFYPTDWRADPALRMCSAAARGVWIDLICLMHEATPYGHLLVNGRCPTDAQVAVLTGTPPDQLTQCLRELEDAGVFSRTKDGTIYSRKLTRMAKNAATARNNGRRGGNPNLGNRKENLASDNPPVKGGDKPQKPEARSQIEDPPNPPSGGGFDDFWNAWPEKQDRVAAERAWRKLDDEDRALAAAKAAAWFAWWRKAHPDAAPLGASRFLRSRRWEDEGFEAKPAAPIDIRVALADRIKSGKPYLVRDITPATARDLMAAGLVTEDDCRKAGVA